MTLGKPTLADSLYWADDYYVVADLGGGAFAIGEPLYGQCNFSYLIVGTKRALLFDGGPGVRNIAPLVHSLTRLPVEALPSHLHFDHTGNLNRFEDVALPAFPKLLRQVRGGRFFPSFNQYLGFVEGFELPSLQVAQWIPIGSDIDLGGRQLTLVSVPGHTPESIVLFDRLADRLYAGDFIYPSEIYAFLPGANLSDYAASARRVGGMLDDRAEIYAAHGCEGESAVGVPLMQRSDVVALAASMDSAARSGARLGRGWFPRAIPVNDRMTLLAKYPWMAD
jgi:glyoxylase-like metal-dependent hydrolase (beta-lactamase superfamily II)